MLKIRKKKEKFLKKYPRIFQPYRGDPIVVSLSICTGEFYAGVSAIISAVVAAVYPYSSIAFTT